MPSFSPPSPSPPFISPSFTFCTCAYLRLQLGFALHSLLYHVFVTARRNDFMEMFVHHCATVLLIAFSFVAGMSRVAVVVSIYLVL